MSAGPLAGRRLFLVGIGGSGMSAYAIVARARGAAVAGWDRSETPYLAGLDGIAVEISPGPPRPPAGFEVFVSSAHPGLVEGRPRGELLAELVAAGPAIVVGGAHGKTTTTSMIAYVLDRLGRDPSFVVGGEVPQLGANARGGAGWLVAEGDESDRSLSLLRPTVAVVTNVDLDHHTTFASLAEVDELFAAWLDAAPHAVRGWELEPVGFELAVPGVHNRRNAATALAALELAGVPRGEAIPVLAEFRGAGRRYEAKGDAGGVIVVDDYGHHPREVAATIEAARSRHAGRVVVLFQPHLYSRTRHLAGELAAALALADAAVVMDVYPAREQPVPGVTGRLVLDALASLRPGMSLGWAPSVAAAVQLLGALVRPGDLVLTVGAGDVERAGPLLLEELAR